MFYIEVYLNIFNRSNPISNKNIIYLGFDINERKSEFTKKLSCMR